MDFFVRINEHILLLFLTVRKKIWTAWQRTLWQSSIKSKNVVKRGSIIDFHGQICWLRFVSIHISQFSRYLHPRFINKFIDLMNRLFNARIANLYCARNGIPHFCLLSGSQLFLYFSNELHYSFFRCDFTFTFS